MKLIIKPRQKGKTMGLIYTSESTGYVIICPDRDRAKNVANMAKKMGCNIPDPISIDDVLHSGNVLKTKDNKFLIDDVELILEDALRAYLGCEIFAATLSVDPKVEEHFGQSNVGKLVIGNDNIQNNQASLLNIENDPTKKYEEAVDNGDFK